MRLFVALPIPEEVKEEVAELQGQVPDGVGNMRFTKPEQAHVTLAFIGDVSEDKASVIMKSLEDVSFDKFSLETNGLGFFPNENYIRVFWLGFKESGELKELAEDVRDNIPGYEQDHPFHAHVTIARVKSLPGKPAFKAAVEEMEPKSVVFEADEFCLMKSTLTGDGPVYEVVERYGVE